MPGARRWPSTSAPRSKTRRMRVTTPGSMRTSGQRIVASRLWTSGRWTISTVALCPSCTKVRRVARPRRRPRRRRSPAPGGIPSMADQSYGRPVAQPDRDAPCQRPTPRAERRPSACGARWAARRKSAWNASLKRRTLPKPEASAISAIGRRVSWMSCLAKSTRRVWATATGEAPRCCWKRRRSCRPPTPSRSASASTLASSPSSSPSRDEREPAGHRVGRAAPGARDRARSRGGSAGRVGSLPPGRRRRWDRSGSARASRARAGQTGRQ